MPVIYVGRFSKYFAFIDTNNTYSSSYLRGRAFATRIMAKIGLQRHLDF